MHTPQTLALHPLADADIALMETWLCQPRIKKWYDPIEEWLEEMRERQGKFAWLHDFIYMDGETPVGFGRFYDCYDSVGLEDWNGRLFPARGEVYSIDYLIGNEAYLGKGYGKDLVRRLSEAAFALGAREIIVDPDGENAASNGVLRANGYRLDNSYGYYIKVRL
ncbi:MAG: acetyltransferase [Oscillospiraceae bacterium]|jgi:RimJ/RimL family protein N-acetyltransferase|nr:acetyltransferase [Oscillospiraceae bacterium]